MAKATRWVATSDLEIIVDKEPWRLPKTLQQQVNQYWDGLVRHGTPFFRGPVLSVRQVHEQGASVLIEGVLTDYAHYLFSRQLPAQHPYQVRVMFAAACLVTSDNWLISGVMSPETSRPGWIQAIGGSPNFDDIVDGHFLPVSSARREALEEVGIEIPPSRCQVKGFTQDEMGRIAIAVSMSLEDRCDEILNNVRRYLHALSQHGPTELEDVLGIPIGPSGLHVLESQTRPVVRYLKSIVQGFYTGG
ncbi:hypothetical protein [Sulfobacillus thermosulfidooxidans]|uniref:hypothetical protein n=1 Tax=Sulfobacillus thermosulfidooxidans TaxID=28034 RepID=UPI0006B6416C|nr:hypothetical protein [Sulfobacillus thermosulfidooxidans]